ncbi:hypothetical protein [Streptomyces sp. URMC 129]|uniref:hypothetical protein n=1 Tax=Streptomyces sp. URMC 129 TaxID=3423407 RepID=UPI003F53B073
MTPGGGRAVPRRGDLAGLLDAPGIRRTAVGSSPSGGAGALKPAARWPDRIAAPALLSTRAPGHRPGDAPRALGEGRTCCGRHGDTRAMARR